MTIREIVPSGPVNALIKVPGSKSITNRALVCAALAAGKSVLRNASSSDDTGLFINGLNQLGVLVQRTEDRTGGEAELHVHGTSGRLYGPKFPVPVSNAGTTLRFLLALSTLASGRTVFEGSTRMAERPIDDLLDALRSLGAEAAHDAGSTQFIVEGGGLQGGTVVVNAEKSSQFLTAILLVAPYCRQEVVIRVADTMTSGPYVGMTLSVMRRFGVEVSMPEGGVFAIEGVQRYRPTEFTVEPDASGATYVFAAAAIAGGEAGVRGLAADSLQGDSGFPEVLRRMGCDIRAESGPAPGLWVSRDRHLHGVEIDMNAMPDAVPALVAVALFAETPTRISNVAQLRFKESDRIASLASELKKLGADIDVSPDGLAIRPAPLHGGTLDTHDDHRLAMSFALIGLRVPGVRIANPECVTKSFPGFWTEFRKISHYL